MAFPWAAIAVVASAGKAYAAYYDGMAKKAYYDAQADLKLLQYKDKRIESKEAGVKVLEKTNEALAAIIAKGGAGGILTDEGTIVTGQITSLRNITKLRCYRIY